MVCPDAVLLQGFVAASLDASERASIEDHIDTCPACRKLVAALASPTHPTLVESGSRPPGPQPVQIGRYRVVGQLGRGGMGVVYRAHDPDLRRELAIKLLRADRRVDSETSRARLVREAQAMAQISHPNVVAVYDVGTWSDEVFVAMELLTGGTLRHWCRDRSPSEILGAYLAAGRGLAAAHAAALVHRDFKPDNVLVGSDGRVCVTDFGLASAHDAPLTDVEAGVPDVGLTVTGAVMGTPGYMAPEIYSGATCDARGDQFAFCVSVWEALHGERPFRVTATIEADVPPTTARDLPTAIDRALRRGLSANPADRWPSMTALLAALDAPGKSRSWRRLAVAGAAAAGLAGVAIVAWPDRAAAPAPPVALDPVAASSRSAIEPRLHRAITDWIRGDRDAARSGVRAAIAVARTLGSTAVLAEALTIEGYWFEFDRDLTSAEAALGEALELAEKVGDDPVKTRAIAKLVDVLDAAGRPDERLRRLARAAAERTSSDDDIHASAIETEAASTPDLARSRARWDEALVLRDKVGRLRPRAANRIGVATAQLQAGRPDDARATLAASLLVIDAQAIDPYETAMAVAGTQDLLASVEMARRDFAAAAEAARRAIAAWASVAGVESAMLVSSYEALGRASSALHDRTAADAAFARALTIAHDTPARQATTHALMAIAAADDTRTHDAVVEAEAAVASANQAFGADHPAVSQFELMLSKLLVRDLQLPRARALSEALLAKLDAATTPAMMLADARFVLARSLPAESPRARALAVQARDGLRSLGAAGAEHLADVEAWLAAHADATPKN